MGSIDLNWYQKIEGKTHAKRKSNAIANALKRWVTGWIKNAASPQDKHISQKTIMCNKQQATAIHISIIIITKMHRSENIQRIYGYFTFAIFQRPIYFSTFLCNDMLSVLLPFSCVYKKMCTAKYAHLCISNLTVNTIHHLQ